MRKIITLQSSDGTTISVTPAQYDMLAAGEWPMSRRGASLSSVSYGAHPGTPTLSDEAIGRIASGESYYPDEYDAAYPVPAHPRYRTCDGLHDADVACEAYP